MKEAAFQEKQDASLESPGGGGGGGGGGGVLKKVVRVQPYPFIYHFFQKRHLFGIPFIGKRNPFHIPS